MVKIDVEYTGALRCRAVHGPSSASLTTDAPRDNHGKGEAFSPTDTLATALGTCMLTVMGIACNNAGWILDGARATVEKHMTTEPPRRVARLVVRVTIPSERSAVLDEAARKELERTAENCPVRLSLAASTEVVTHYDWQV